MLDSAAQALVIEHRQAVVGSTVYKYRNDIVTGYFTRDEIESAAVLALCVSAARWPEYCAKNGYSQDATQFFAAYAKRRAFGAVIDQARAMDPLPDLNVLRSSRINLHPTFVLYPLTSTRMNGLRLSPR